MKTVERILTASWPAKIAVLMSADSCLKVVGEKNLFLHKPFGKVQLALSVRQALDGI